MTINGDARRLCRTMAFAGLMTVCAVPAFAQALSYSPGDAYGQRFPQYAATEQSGGASDQLAPELQRQTVSYQTNEAPGTVVVDTGHTFLYLVLGDGKAMRYGIGVGRQGFTWSGVETITRKAEWPDWTPPPEMIARQPYLPRWVSGGPGNPLGARALYLGHTDYRIHGTNDPSTIGKRVSSGCIRLRNEDVSDLYSRIGVGTEVVVLPNDGRRISAEGSHATAVEKGHGRMSAVIPTQPSADRMAAGSAPAAGNATSGIY
jgi:lipoprotein-anchoring transpeptidase ErfK/SrfK